MGIFERIFERIFDYFADRPSGGSGVSYTEINPATGLPMVSGIGSVDVGGNPYGADLHRWEDSGIPDTGHDWHHDHGTCNWDHWSHTSYGHDPFSGDW